MIFRRRRAEAPTAAPAPAPEGPPADTVVVRTDDRIERPEPTAPPRPKPRTPRRRRPPALMRAFGMVATGLTVVAIGWPLTVVALHTAGHPPTPLMMWRQASGATVTRVWTPLERIDPDVAVAVIASEDNGFCGHAGVDWGELQDVMDEDGGPRRGGSTITMQVAKNIFLWNGYGWLRKPLEIPLAVAIDAIWSKDKILEIYLNIAEWGPTGEFGIEAGARRAFGKSAARLAPREAALLTAMLPNPHTRDARRPSPHVAHVAGIVQRRAARSPELADCISTVSR